MKKIIQTILVFILIGLTGCRPSADPSGSADALIPIDDHYRNTYEIFVYSFHDSNGDGIGDLNGVKEKLNYIQDLGFNAIWLMPVCSSPTYHKYDVSDYQAIDPQYGTMEDFETLVSECHQRNMEVYTDLVLNHTSTHHPWFKEASNYLQSGKDYNENECPYLGYFHFSKNAEYGYAKLENSEWYYEARFWDQMPDLNLDNQNVRDEIKEIMNFWLDKGVDGFRLDAVTSYYTSDDQKNIDFLKWVNETGKSIKKDCYFVAEAWTGLEQYAPYYQSGIDSFFDFAYSGSDGIITKTVKGQISAKQFVESLVKEEQLFKSYHSDFINAPFYTNHDMARACGYFPGDNGTELKLALGLHFMMGGNAFLYYGEEIGMRGSGKDENKRAPMFWSKESDCTGVPNMDSITMKYDPVDMQMEDENSIYNYVKEILKIRNRYPVIARGETLINETLTTDTLAVFEKKKDGLDSVQIIINLSKDPQSISLEDYTTLSSEVSALGKTSRIHGNTLDISGYGIVVMTSDQ